MIEKLTKEDNDIYKIIDKINEIIKEVNQECDCVGDYFCNRCVNRKLWKDK